MTPLAEETRGHYDRLAGSYDENWGYSAEFVGWMSRQISDRLDLRAGDRVADIGCGTGLYSKGLADRAGSVICVEPSPGMLGQLPSEKAFIPVQASAEDVASGQAQLPYGQLDAILVKEAIHHVCERTAVLQGLTRLLAPSGRLLVVMLPIRIDYPLFTAALEMFERLQPDPADIAEALREVGLRVDLEYESFELSFDKQRYLSMVRGRYLSLLSSFSDTELERGIVEIDERFSSDGLTFPDRFAFVRGESVVMTP